MDADESFPADAMAGRVSAKLDGIGVRADRPRSVWRLAAALLPEVFLGAATQAVLPRDSDGRPLLRRTGPLAGAISILILLLALALWIASLSP